MTDGIEVSYQIIGKMRDYCLACIKRPTWKEKKLIEDVILPRNCFLNYQTEKDTVVFECLDGLEKLTIKVKVPEKEGEEIKIFYL